MFLNHPHTTPRPGLASAPQELWWSVSPIQFHREWKSTNTSRCRGRPCKGGSYSHHSRQEQPPCGVWPTTFAHQRGVWKEVPRHWGNHHFVSLRAKHLVPICRWQSVSQQCYKDSCTWCGFIQSNSFVSLRWGTMDWRELQGSWIVWTNRPTSQNYIYNIIQPFNTDMAWSHTMTGEGLPREEWEQGDWISTWVWGCSSSQDRVISFLFWKLYILFVTLSPFWLLVSLFVVSQAFDSR